MSSTDVRYVSNSCGTRPCKSRPLVTAIDKDPGMPVSANRHFRNEGMDVGLINTVVDALPVLTQALI